MISDAVEIPWQSLETDVLERLLAEIVTRDGTDYGAVERTTEAKIQAALAALRSGNARLFWHTETETSALVATDQIREQQAAFKRHAQNAGLDDAPF